MIHSQQALEDLLPPKRSDLAVRPEVVDVVGFEKADSMDVRARSFPAGADFLNQSAFQFGAGVDNDENWTDEDDDSVDQECRQQ